jgi:hypothetical protein
VRLLSGIEAGIIGGIAMLALLVAGSLVRGDPWWTTPNLLATTFYGMRAFRGAPNQATLTGSALHLVIAGTVGAAFGLLCGGIEPRRRLVLIGTLAGLVWYGLADAVLWRQVNPLVTLYSPQPVTLLSHALFGACLGSMGKSLQATPQGNPTAEPDQVTAQTASQTANRTNEVE